MKKIRLILLAPSTGVVTPKANKRNHDMIRVLLLSEQKAIRYVRMAFLILGIWDLKFADYFTALQVDTPNIFSFQKKAAAI